MGRNGKVGEKSVGLLMLCDSICEGDGVALRRRGGTEEVVRCDILLELVGGGEELKMKVKLIT